MMKTNKHWMWALAPAFALGLAACEDDTVEVEPVGTNVLPSVSDNDLDVDADLTGDLDDNAPAMALPERSLDTDLDANARTGELGVIAPARVDIEKEIDVRQRDAKVVVSDPTIERGMKTVTKEVEVELPRTITKTVEVEVPTAEVVEGRKTIDVPVVTTVEEERDPEGGQNMIDSDGEIGMPE